MDKLLWRSRAKFVAYLQFAFLGLSLILVVFFGILLCDRTFPIQTGLSGELERMTLTQKVKHYLNDMVREILDHFQGKFFEHQLYYFLAYRVQIYVWWIAYVILVIVTGVQWWLSSKLMRATEIGRNPRKALSNLVVWRNVTAGFLILKVFIYVVCLYAAVSTATGPARLHLACVFILIASMIEFFLKFSFYSVVCKFINELAMHSPVFVV